MHYFIYPKKDTTLYSQYPAMNTGTDQILELTKTVDGSSIYNTRILIQFDTASMKVASASAATNGKSVGFYLNLYTAKAYNLPLDYTIEAYAVSQSWTMGTGKYYDSPQTTDGVSWTYRAESTNWKASGSDYILNGVSQSFSFEESDPKIDVTPIINSWLSNSYANNGFLLKRPAAEETGSTEYGRLTFYSLDTNTVYLPTLEAVWDDSTFITGSTQFVMSGSYSGQFIGTSSVHQVGSSSGFYIGNAKAFTRGTVTASNVSHLIHSISGSYAFFSGSIDLISFVASGSTNALYKGSISGSITASSISGGFIGQVTQSTGFSFFTSTGMSQSLFTGSIMGAAYDLEISAPSSVLLSVSGSISGTIDKLEVSMMDDFGFDTIDRFSGKSSAYMEYTGSYTGSISGTVDGYSSGSFVGEQSGSLTGSFIPVLIGVSFEPITSDQVSIIMKNLKPQYKYKTNARIRFSGKDLNQRKTFAVVPLSAFSIIKYLPIGTQYSVVDAYSGRVIIPFDSYTKISCDLEGNYFDLDLNGFMPDRFYKIVFKVTIGGSVTFIDKNYIFKVVK